MPLNIMGMPEEIAYDQGSPYYVSENAGDIILKFQAYKEQRGFRVYLCRKSDPESKGKIENVVKYVKYNFADSRKFINIDNWNERCLAWLKRTGNQINDNISLSVGFSSFNIIFLLYKCYERIKDLQYQHLFYNGKMNPNLLT